MLSRRSLAGALVALTLLSLAAGAQASNFGVADNPRQFGILPHRILLARGLIFEAQVAPGLVLWESFEVWRRWHLVAQFTPLVRLRMIDDRSAPVRTPSYMPRGNVQLHYAFENDARRWKAVGVDVTVGHHSNGQDGCFRAGSIVPCDPSDPTTIVDQPLYDHDVINKVDGNFATNYYRVTLFLNSVFADPALPQNAGGQASLGVYWEHHPEAWVWEPLMKNGRYGRYRLGFEQLAQFSFRSVLDLLQGIRGKGLSSEDAEEVRATYQRYPNLISYRIGFRVAADFQIVEPARRGPNHAVTVELFGALRNGLGVFIQVHTGEDYYNLGFEDDVTLWQVGARWTTERFRETFR